MSKRPKPYANRSTLIVYLLLRVLVVLTAVRAIFRGDYESVFLCVLTMVLMLLPSIVSRKLRIVLPNTLEIIILLFIFAAEILGEVNSFYVNVPYWDTMLHTFNGFGCAAIGFSLVDMMNRSERFSFKLSPLYVAIAAFCFSMTVGVCWEFFEYAADRYLHVDMQKDTVLSSFSSVTLDETKSNIAIRKQDITGVILEHSDGSQEKLDVNGYLDVGLNDTMKDLLVNLIGAVVFSVIGFFYVKYEGKNRFAARFIPQVERGPRSD